MFGYIEPQHRYILSRVCKRWLHISRNQRLWKNTKINLFTRDLDDLKIYKPCLTKLNLNFKETLLDYHWLITRGGYDITYLREFIQLKCLHLAYEKCFNDSASAKYFFSFISFPYTLEHLSIAKLFIGLSEISNLSLQCPNLTYLDLSEAEGINDPIINRLSRGLENRLLYLFVNCFYIENAKSYLNIAKLKKLVQLGLTNVQKDLEDVFFYQISKLSDLESLSLNCFGTVKFAVVDPCFTYKFLKLKRLVIIDTAKVYDLDKILSYIPNLEFLFFALSHLFTESYDRCNNKKLLQDQFHDILTTNNSLKNVAIRIHANGFKSFIQDLMQAKKDNAFPDKNLCFCQCSFIIQNDSLSRLVKEYFPCNSLHKSNFFNLDCC